MSWNTSEVIVALVLAAYGFVAAMSVLGNFTHLLETTSLPVWRCGVAAVWRGVLWPFVK